MAGPLPALNPGQSHRRAKKPPGWVTNRRSDLPRSCLTAASRRGCRGYKSRVEYRCWHGSQNRNQKKDCPIIHKKTIYIKNQLLLRAVSFGIQYPLQNTYHQWQPVVSHLIPNCSFGSEYDFYPIHELLGLSYHSDNDGIPF